MHTVTCNNTGDITEFTDEDEARSFYFDVCWDNPNNNYTLRHDGKHIVTKGPAVTFRTA